MMIIILCLLQILLLREIDPTDAFQQHVWQPLCNLPDSSMIGRQLSNTRLALTSRANNIYCTVGNKRPRLLPRCRHRWAQSHSTRTDQQENLTVDEDEDDDDDEDATFTDKSEEEKFFDEAERDANRQDFPKGKPEDYYVTKQYSIPDQGFESLLMSADGESQAIAITQEEVDRLGINRKNITLPIALMLLDKETYPSLSRARKECRKGRVVVNRGPLTINTDTGNEEFDQDTCFKGRVIDRVYPGDIIGIQCRLHGGFYPGFDTTKPAFELPVVYEDSHFAIVNKPAGVVCYSQRDDSHGKMTIRHALPFVLKPPKRGIPDIYLRPVGVHRLDKPTSGLLVVAKTKPALVNLSKQFEERRAKKTYTAIVNGIPTEPIETSITSAEAMTLGVHVGGDGSTWQLIDHPLDEKSAVTIWKPLSYTKSLKAKDETLTLVELKPKTGRYHQLRRHMSWVKECPLVGDTTYDDGDDAVSLRGRGLFLCSNEIRLEHPYYNTAEGKKEWEALSDDEKWGNEMLALSEDGSAIEVNVSIDLPNKFQSFLATEQKRYNKLGESK